MDLSTVAQAALRGAVAGLGGGLLALAVVVTFRATGVLNLALGGVASVSAYVVWRLWAQGSASLFVAIVVALIVAGVIGAVSHALIRPLEAARPAVTAVATLGILLVLQASISFVWGRPERFLPLLVSGAAGSGELRLGWQQVLTAAVAVAAALLLGAWARATPSGTAALAIGEDRDAARLLGIRPTRLAAAVWAVAGVLAGGAGILLSGLTVLNGSEMTLALVTSLAAALLARMERFSVAMAGAAAVGALTAIAGSIPAVVDVPGLVGAVAFLAVIAVAVARPRELVA
jgi:branched-subunit amino acid ABC-type transport system permease component